LLTGGSNVEYVQANVMLEYTLDDAELLLTKNHTAALKSLEIVDTDLGFLRDQTTTIEVSILSDVVNSLITTLKLQSNGLSYSSTVIGTLAVDGSAVTFGTARRGLGGAAACPGPFSMYRMSQRIICIIRCDSIIAFRVFRVKH